ncbi:MAG: hypothetical protein HRT69_17235 [Flavobacteriaceae bacterium]|nr:hypothetical protein [Flavobacteriaceae bacterium]
MNNIEFSNILKQPQGINEQQTMGLKGMLNDFPYFQSARALYLKGLKNEESYSYNYELKLTAAYTADRNVLFDYITSDSFNQNIISKVQQKLQKQVNDIEVVAAEEISIFDSETSSYDEQVLNPDLFEEKTAENTTAIAEENLAIGTPLEFNTNETHSFQEWLKLSAIPIIERKEVREEKKPKNLRNVDLINKFITSKPKIKPVRKTVSLKNLAKENSFSSNELMTETLAKVYLEQKNYKKAIQAYRILSLKYPEKNSFFADRIADLEQIEINNTK